jgi:hypothetical protein
LLTLLKFGSEEFVYGLELFRFCWQSSYDIWR